LAPNTSTSLQTTSAADAHLAERQFLHEKQTLNKAKSWNAEQELEEQQFTKQKDRI
jgi:hypothetical protein